MPNPAKIILKDVIVVALLALTLPLTASAYENREIGPNAIDPQTKNQMKEIKEKQLKAQPIENNTNKVRREVR